MLYTTSTAIQILAFPRRVTPTKRLLHVCVSPVRRFITESVCESQPSHLPRFRQDPRKVLGPRGAAKHTLGVVMTRLVAEHGAFAGGVGARSMPWVVAPRQQVALEGSLEGRRGVALLLVVVELANHFEQVEGRT